MRDRTQGAAAVLRTLAAWAAATALVAAAGCLPEPAAFQQGAVGDGGGGGGGVDTAGGGGGGDTGGSGDAGADQADTGGVAKKCAIADDCGTASVVCREKVCNPDGTCGERDAPDNTGCEDNNPCTVDDRCKTGKCVSGGPKNCDDGKYCTTDSCESADGACKNVPKEGAPCDDGEPCTTGTKCKSGECEVNMTHWTCACHPDAKPGDGSGKDCAGSSVNKCLGEYQCSRPSATEIYSCKLNPATTVVCDTSLDTQCLRNWCDPTVGSCAMTPVEILKKKAPNSGAYTTDCNDGDPCTPGDECANGECVGGTSTCECSKNDVSNCYKTKGFSIDPCKGQVYCANYKAGPPPALNIPNLKDFAHCAINPATTYTACDNKSTTCVTVTPEVDGDKCKCVSKPVAKPDCDDGDACTANDGCDAQGKCVGGTLLCLCTKDADCVDKDDGNLCNGSLYCDVKDGKCKLNPATVVGECPTVDDSTCIKNICYGHLGVCKLTPVENIHPDGKPYPVPKAGAVLCDDGNDCTPSDVCDKGICKAGESNLCSCKADADCVDDDGPCNGKPYCDLGAPGGGKCKNNPATIVTCSSINDSTCAKNTCDKKTGKCAMTPVFGTSVFCDDGDKCTAVSTCVDGKCPAGTPICKCAVDADCAKEDDGDLCNGTMFCNKVLGACQVNPATIKTCPKGDDTECLANTCEKKTGACKLNPIRQFESCNPGDPCLASPVCVDGSCFAETNLCQCLVDADCAKYDDGNLCNGVPYCDKSVPGAFACKVNQAKVVTCPQTDDTCMDNLCAKDTGKCTLQPRPDFVITCEDGNPCTAGDSCVGGKCTAGTNTCGCQQDSDCEQLGQFNKCNTWFCDKSVAGKFECKINQTKKCAEGGPDSCLVEKCNHATGNCENVSAAVCNDNNPCTIDECDTKTAKCGSKPAPDLTPCSAGGAAGVCLAGSDGKSVCAVPPGPNLSLLPKGSSFRGCVTKDSGCFANESPQHEVQFAASVWIDRFEVTVARYKACVTGGGCSEPALKDAGCTYAGSETERPVNCVSHAEAAAFCTWAGGKMTPTSKGRLPTEAEWERAARGGCEQFAAGACKDAVRVYPWGDVPTPSCAMTTMKGDTSDGCNSGGPLNVGARPNDRSLYDVFDMLGNVAEWVQDAFDNDAYSKISAPAQDPLVTGGAGFVIRGGSFSSSDAKTLRASARIQANAATPTTGFRCVYP